MGVCRFWRRVHFGACPNQGVYDMVSGVYIRYRTCSVHVVSGYVNMEGS